MAAALTNAVVRARREVLVARAIDIISERACDPTLSRKKIARELGVSPSLLAHSVKRLTGFTITQHICRARLAAAERLMLDPARSCAIHQGGRVRRRIPIDVGIRSVVSEGA
jgi:AraC-like DNA-binding protein